MDLIAKSPTHEPGDDLVVRESFLGHLGFTVVLGALALAWCAAPLLSPWGWIPAVLIGLPCLGVTLVLASGLARARRAPRWVLRAHAGRLTLALRSAWNADLAPDDATAVRLERDEVESLRAVARTEVVPDRDGAGTRTRRRRWLEIRLTHAETATLERPLLRERERRGVGRTHFQVVPLELVAPDTLRMDWGRLRPGLGPSLRRLGRHLRVLEPRDEGRLDTLTLEDGELEGVAL